MKTHSTNYFNTFIEIAEYCPVTSGEIPPVRGDNKTVAHLQFDLISKHPYRFTSDDVSFQVFADRNDLTESEYKEAREKFFSKGQSCFRASPLTKRYGWGIHSDREGKIALYSCDSAAYKKLSTDTFLKVIKAMRSNK